MRHGFGTDRSWYKGEFKGNKMDGQGELTIGEKTVKGQFRMTMCTGGRS